MSNVSRLLCECHHIPARLCQKYVATKITILPQIIVIYIYIFTILTIQVILYFSPTLNRLAGLPTNRNSKSRDFY